MQDCLYCLNQQEFPVAYKLATHGKQQPALNSASYCIVSAPSLPPELCLPCSAGYKLDPPALQVVFNRFDPSRSGSLQLTEFLALTLFMRSATATFNAFDSNRAGTIK
jgi:hypothetical protein